MANLMYEQINELELSPEQTQIMSQVNLLGREIIGDHASKVDQEARYPYEAIEALKQSNLTQVAIPKRFGGYGAGYGGDVLILPLILMEIASWCSSTSQVLALHNSAVQYINVLGNEEQKRYFFNEVALGNMFCSLGSEASLSKAKIRSTLSKSENQFTLNGYKRFATGSPGAKWAFWHAIDSDEQNEEFAKLLMPLVCLQSQGVRVNLDWDGIGQRGTGSGTVLAENVTIDAFNLLGTPNQFAAYTDFFQPQFNIHFSAQFTGIAIGAVREAIKFLKHKRGISKGESTVIELRLGELQAKVSSAKQMVIYSAKILHAYNSNPSYASALKKAASEAKIITTEVALEVTNTIFQLLGASSALRREGLDLYYRNARTLTLHDPVDNHKLILGSLSFE